MQPRGTNMCMRLAFVSLLACSFPFEPAAAGENVVAVAHPDWSPDGCQLAFEAELNGARNVFVMDAAYGSNVRQLTFGDAMDSYPRYSPDGRWLVFLSRRHGAFSMHLVRADGNDETALLPADGNLEPAFSPDGRWVVFRTYLGGDDEDGEIMVVDLDGNNQRRLTDNAVEDGFPAFSADGRSVFFHRVIGDFRQIVRLDLDSGAETQLTDGEFNSWHAHPSADGRRIVYSADRTGNRDIYVMELESRNVKQLTSDPGRDDYPKFSPDARFIAFHSDRCESTCIIVMKDDGSGQVPVIPDWSAVR